MARSRAWRSPALDAAQAPTDPDALAAWIDALPVAGEPDPNNVHGSSDLMRVTLPDGGTAIRKRHRHVGVRATLRGIGRFTWFADSRGRHEGEWLVRASELAAADLPVPPVPGPLAWVESKATWSTRSAVLMEAIDGVQALDHWIDGCFAVAEPGAPVRAQLFATLASVTRAVDAMHRAGMAHLDLHWRNIMVRAAAATAFPEALDWWLIDGAHARWGTASTRIIDDDRVADQAAWLLWLDLLKPTDAERLAVGASFSGDVADAWDQPREPDAAWRARVRWAMARLAARERKKALRRMPHLSGDPAANPPSIAAAPER
jgi:hypothetical protein